MKAQSGAPLFPLGPSTQLDLRKLLCMGLNEADPIPLFTSLEGTDRGGLGRGQSLRGRQVQGGPVLWCPRCPTRERSRVGSPPLPSGI